MATKIAFALLSLLREAISAFGYCSLYHGQKEAKPCQLHGLSPSPLYGPFATDTRADDREHRPVRRELMMENSHGNPPLQVLGLLAGDGALKIFKSHLFSPLTIQVCKQWPYYLVPAKKKKKQGLGLFLEPDR